MIMARYLNDEIVQVQTLGAHAAQDLDGIRAHSGGGRR